MDAERKSFLGSIGDNLADDTVRLAYADWLTEHGENDRGMLIRKQIEVERLQKEDISEEEVRRYESLTREERELEEAVCLKLDLPESMYLWFSRGMIESVDSPWDEWATRGDRLLETELVPLVRLTTATFMSRDVTEIHDGIKRETTTRMRVECAGKILAFQHIMDDRELSLSPHALGRSREKLDYNSSPKKCCELRWPGVKFEIRPDLDFTLEPQDANDPGQVAVARFVERELRERLTLEERFALELAAVHGIRLPQEARRMTRLSFVSEVPATMQCDCPTIRMSRFVVDESPPLTATLLVQSFSLNRRRYAAVRGRNWIASSGQCPRCRMVFFAVTPEPSPPLGRPTG